MINLQVLFTYNEQDDIALHYLKTFDGKQIMAAENYLTETEEDTKQETEVKESESGTRQQVLCVSHKISWWLYQTRT